MIGGWESCDVAEEQPLAWVVGSDCCSELPDLELFIYETAWLLSGAFDSLVFWHTSLTSLPMSVHFGCHEVCVLISTGHHRYLSSFVTMWTLHFVVSVSIDSNIFAFPCLGISLVMVHLNIMLLFFSLYIFSHFLCFFSKQSLLCLLSLICEVYCFAKKKKFFFWNEVGFCFACLFTTM